MIHMSKKSFIAVLLVLVLMLIASSAMAAEGKVTTESGLLMREEPNTTSNAIYTLGKGAKVSILYKDGNWYRITYGKYEGFAYAGYIQTDDTILTKKHYDNGEYILQKGDSGELVKELQADLKTLGFYKNSCDGNFGDQTKDAVIAFQKANSLTADGVAGTSTLKKIAAQVDKATEKEETVQPSDGTLKKGDKGAEVKKLQQRLKELGYYKPSCDSSYGSQTVTAVKKFQANNGLEQTGIADPATQKKLYADSAIDADGAELTLSTNQTLKLGSSGEQVKLMQKRLKELGYYSAGADGSFGYQTLKAVVAFQKNNKLTDDGVAGPSTLKKMVSSSALKAGESADKEEEKEDEKLETDNSLKKGDSGEAVKALQRRLKELGYYTNYIDGDFGSQTVTAVKAFQKKNGLTDDGVAGSVTLTKLNSSSAIPANGKTEEDKVEDEELKATDTLKKGDKGAKVKALQTRLKELGYYKPMADGEYGSQTIAAVKAFQGKNGLTADGVAGSDTIKKLLSDSAIDANGKSEEDKEADKEEPSDGTLRKGDKGDAVKALQKRLKELGYYTNYVDGSYGDQTVKAVKAFQKKNGLTDDGVAGSVTLTKLNSSSAIPANGKTEEDKVEDEELKATDTLKKGDKGAKVKALQTRLKELGYYKPMADGEYGSQTIAAVKAFQGKNGLTADGVAGSDTIKKLLSDSAIDANGKSEEDKEADKEEPSDGTLRKGDKGDAVTALQARLRELGYFKPLPDGDYGNQTVAAVKAFQEKNGLTADGVAGPDTLKKLESDSAINANGVASDVLQTNQTLRKGDEGAQVKALQKRLTELGYYTTVIDSNYGYRTAEAVSAFQRGNGLTVDGVAGPATLRKLVSDSAITKEEADKKQEEEDKEQGSTTPGDDDEKTYVTESLDWFEDGQDLFKSKTTLQVKDCKTGLVFTARVMYGTNHLDAEPLTAADTEILRKINGGEFTWVRRPMLVLYKDHVYAASIYSEPHGDQYITDNNFDGQFCLHFTGSKLHKKDENGNYKDDADHQKCVQQALNYTW